MTLGSINARASEPAHVDSTFADFAFYDDHGLQGENSQLRNFPPDQRYVMPHGE